MHIIKCNTILCLYRLGAYKAPFYFYIFMIKLYW